MSINPNLTPLKFTTATCIACGIKNPDRPSRIQHSLRDLFYKYCDVNVADGIACRNCSRQLHNIHEKVSALKIKTAQTVATLTGKRLQASMQHCSSKKIVVNVTSISPSPSRIPIRNVDIRVPLPQPIISPKRLTISPSKLPIAIVRQNQHVAVAVRRKLLLPKPEILEVCDMMPLTNGNNIINMTVKLVPATDINSSIDNIAAVTVSECDCNNNYVEKLETNSPKNGSDDQLAHQIYLDIQNSKKSTCTCSNSTKKPNFLACQRCLMDEVDLNVSKFKSIHHWKHGQISVLESRYADASMKNNNLLKFDWCQLITEMRCNFPRLFSILLGLMANDIVDESVLKNLYPRLGMIYAIIMQSRASDMSLLQRLVSLILLDANAEVHVSFYLLLFFGM
jgi:hypothetical protein